MTETQQELLQALVHAIHSTINKGLAQGTLQPEYIQCFRWKLTEFKYDDTGFAKKSARGKKCLRPYWGKAVWDINQRIGKLSVYKDILTAISKRYNVAEAQCDYYLQALIAKVAENILEGKIKTPSDSDKYVALFLKDLNGEEQEYRTEVHLKGLILQPRLIKLDDNTTLRKPNRKDFEKEEFLRPSSVGVRHLENPTAFLHTKIYATAPVILPEIDKEISILRLFRVGAVEDMQYSRSTDSIIHMAGGMIGRGRLLGSDKYLITREDVKPLKIFWANMKKVELPIPSREGKKKEPTELSIAYERYSDSLDVGIPEKRISSAVMGLEALYLSPSERQELTYKLSMRASKLLHQIGYSAEKVHNDLIHAYDIRSTYVHGKTLTLRQKKKHEKEVGELNQFPQIVMDYLRASIIALLKIKSKTSLIKKIDDSFLDNAKEDEIKKLLFMPYEKEEPNAAG